MRASVRDIHTHSKHTPTNKQRKNTCAHSPRSFKCSVRVRTSPFCPPPFHSPRPPPVSSSSSPTHTHCARALTHTHTPIAPGWGRAACPARPLNLQKTPHPPTNLWRRDAGPSTHVCACVRARRGGMPRASTPLSPLPCREHTSTLLEQQLRVSRASFRTLLALASSQCFAWRACARACVLCVVRTQRTHSHHSTRRRRPTAFGACLLPPHNHTTAAPPPPCVLFFSFCACR